MLKLQDKRQEVDQANLPKSCAECDFRNVKGDKRTEAASTTEGEKQYMEKRG